MDALILLKQTQTEHTRTHFPPRFSKSQKPSDPLQIPSWKLYFNCTFPLTYLFLWKNSIAIRSLCRGRAASPSALMRACAPPVISSRVTAMSLCGTEKITENMTPSKDPSTMKDVHFGACPWTLNGDTALVLALSPPRGLPAAIPALLMPKSKMSWKQVRTEEDEEEAAGVGECFCTCTKRRGDGSDKLHCGCSCRCCHGVGAS